MTYLRYPFAAPVETFRNLVPNPSMEVDIGTWEAVTGAPSLSRWDAAGWSGTSCLRAASTVAGTLDVGIDKYFVPITALATYTFSAYMAFANGPGRDGRVGLRFYDVAGVQIGATVYGVQAPIALLAWSRFTVTAAAPVGAVYCAPLCRASATAVGEALRVDAAQLEVGAVATTYRDATFPTDLTTKTFYRFTGARWRSPSVAETPGAGDELAPLVDFTQPFEYRRETRARADEAASSSTSHLTYVAPRARSGRFTIICDDVAAAQLAEGFFTSNATFYHLGDPAWAPSPFAVVDGELTVASRHDGTERASLIIPFKELS